MMGRPALMRSGLLAVAVLLAAGMTLGGTDASLRGQDTHVDNQWVIDVQRAGWSQLWMDSQSWYACATAKLDGSLWCWGGSGGAHVGGADQNLWRPEPVIMADGSPFHASQVGTGDGGATCAVSHDDGTVWCWGSNLYGQLGDGTTDSSDRPVQVVDGAGDPLPADTVAVGSYHSCAISSADDTVFCWGQNLNGQVGDGSGTDRLVATQAQTTGGSPLWATNLTATGSFNCAIDPDETVWCWGKNSSSGVLGTGDTNDRSRPTQTSNDGGGPVVADTVAAGETHVCASAPGTAEVVCWGSNARRQLADPSLSSSFDALAVTRGDGSPVVASTSLVAGDDHTCALQGTDAWCWGSNMYGQLTDAAPVGTSVATPTLQADGSGTPLELVEVGAGREASCGLGADRAILCWGRNSAGQLADGTTDDSDVPVGNGGPVAHPSGVRVSVDSRDMRWQWDPADPSGGVDADLDAHVLQYCTGAGCDVQRDAMDLATVGLGTSTFTWSPSFLDVYGPVGLTVRTVNTVGTRSRVGGTVGMPVNTGWVDVDAGRHHTCAIARYDSSLWCWGSNSDGQLGVPDVASVDRPVQAQLSDGEPLAVTQVSAANGHTCVIAAADSTVWCVGANARGQLGTGDTTEVGWLRQAVGEDGSPFVATDVAGGHSHTCAVAAADSTVWCWGSDQAGRLGNGDGLTGDQYHPTPVVNGAAAPLSATDVDSGGTHTCAVSSGQLFCWGVNGHGQLGDGTLTDRSVAVPVRMADSSVLEPFSMAAGVQASCASLVADQSVWCWGDNTSGALGTGAADGDPHPVPEPAVHGDGSPVTASTLEVATSHACVVEGADGTVWCWGSNASGQTGGSEYQTLVPEQPALGGTVPATAASVSVADYAKHSCAGRRDDGLVFCWGDNDFDQLGDATGADSVVPVDPGGPPYPPQQLSLAVDSGLLSDTHTVSWDPVAVDNGPDADLIGINVYYCEGAGCTPSAPHNSSPLPVTATSYQQSGVSKTGTHRWWVGAVNSLDGVTEHAVSYRPMVAN